MKRINFILVPAIATGILLTFSLSYGNNFISTTRGVKQNTIAVLFQDSASKRTTPSKKADIDRTKGEAGRGQGKGTDTVPMTGSAGKRGNGSAMNKSTQDKADQNSDNRGEGAGKNNRAGNNKKEADSTRH